jgi:hypothetical protein
MGKPTENDLIEALHLGVYPGSYIRVAMAVNGGVPGRNPVDIGVAFLIVEVNPFGPGYREHFGMRFMLGQGVPDEFLVSF